MKTSQIYLAGILLVLIPLITACSDNSTNSGSGLGEATLTVTGDVDGNRSGMADFWGLEAGGMYTWEMSIHDFSPQTFSMVIMMLSPEPIHRPGTGTYEIGEGLDTYTATYTDIVDSDYMNATEYSHIICGDEMDLGGTLTIESSDDDLVTGSFEFTVADVDYDPEEGCVYHGIITVNGEFIAKERQF